MDVLEPKGPVNRFGGADILTWAQRQLGVADDILDNPGGGLGAAIQAIGQVKAGLREQGGARFAELVGLLDRAEDQAVHRRFAETRELVRQALHLLS